ncbi:MAG: hypothetical protein JNM59_06455 [Hyphomonadaceae bacterium]|nr:hypothetical protein [Hyphomonadaceae bacterium]
MYEPDRGTTKKPRVGRCVLEERLAELVAATDIKTIDVTEFYTIDDLCRKLKCDQKTLKRRRDDGSPPWFLELAGLRRAPASLFWAWVASEIEKQLVRP